MSNTTLPVTDLVLVGTATASADTSVSFTDLSSKYSLYVLELINITVSSDGASIRLRTSTNNGSSYDSGASDYRYAYFTTQNAAATDSANDFMIALLDIGSAANEVGSGTVYLFDPSASSYTAVLSDGASIGAGGIVVGRKIYQERLSTSAVDAVQLYSSAGTFSGTINLYGYKDA